MSSPPAPLPDAPAPALPVAPAASAARFSSRLQWTAPPNRLSVALHAARQCGRPLLDLTVSNPTRALPELYPAELLAPLGDERGLRYEPSAQGAPAARRSIADYYATRGIRIDPEHLVLSASTSEAYTWLFQLLCNPGQQVLFPQPSYPLLEFLAGLSAVQLVPYPLHFDGGASGHWWLGRGALADACTADTRAIVVVSPNNPTGSFLRKSELLALCALCRTHGLALIVDEVFADYALPRADAAAAAHDPAAAAHTAADPAAAAHGPAAAACTAYDPVAAAHTAYDPAAGADPLVLSVLAAVQDLGDQAPLCFVLSGLSKVVGLPQLKLGWVHVGGPEPLRQAALDRLELIADTFLSVGTPVQLAAPQLLAEQPRVRDAIVARLNENLQLLRAAVHDSACQLLPVEGGWYAVLRLPRLLSEEDWALLLLEEDGVVVHPGYFYDFAQEAYLVLSLLCAPAVLGEGVQRLVRRVGTV